MNEIVEKLTVNLRSELSRQDEILDALEDEKKAIVAHSQNELDQCLSRLIALAERGAALEEERDFLIRKLAPSLGSDPQSLKMRDIVRHLGANHPELSDLHIKLRAATQKVTQFNRNLSQLVKHYRDVYSNALHMVFDAAGVKSIAGQTQTVASGSMLNAEG